MNSASNKLPEGFFRVKVEHCPKEKIEKYARVNYYAVQLGKTVSNLLMQSLLELRKNAYRIQDQAVLKIALKAFTEDEYRAAVKEIMCIWLHLEAIDQEGESMPDWLLGFLRLAFGSVDTLIMQPKAVDVLNSYEECHNLEDLYNVTALKACQILGFGEAAPAFASFIYPVLANAGQPRQLALKNALELPVEVISEPSFNI